MEFGILCREVLKLFVGCAFSFCSICIKRNAVLFEMHSKLVTFLGLNRNICFVSHIITDIKHAVKSPTVRFKFHRRVQHPLTQSARVERASGQGGTLHSTKYADFSRVFDKLHYTVQHIQTYNVSLR